MSGEKPNRRAIVRAELTRRLMSLAPKKQLAALTDSDDAAALIRMIPAEDLYVTIMDVGLADASDVVQLASPTQFRTFVDLAVWQKDTMRFDELLVWLRAARGDEPEPFMAKLHGLDIEVIELLLRHYIQIHDLEENPDVHTEGATITSPEGRFLIEIGAEGLELDVIRRIIQDLIAENPFEATRFFEAIKWELTTELVEQAYQFRSARLEDLGFPTLYEALAMFAFLDPDKLAPAKKTVAPGESLVKSRDHVDFVEAAFRGLDDGERAALAQEVRYLVNAALVAEAAEPGDPSAVRRVSELARDYLSLGLEFLSGGDPAGASDIVREHPLKRAFQVGFSLTLRLKHRVERLIKEPLAQWNGEWLLLEDEAATLSALSRKRPLKALRVEGADPVPFRSLRELAEAGQRIDAAQSQRKILVALLGTGDGGGTEAAQQSLSAFSAALASSGENATASGETVALALALHAAVDGKAQLAPWPTARIGEACAALFEGEAHAPRLRDAAFEKARAAWLARLPDEGAGDPEGGALTHAATVMLQRVLGRLVDTVGAAYLRHGSEDPVLASAFPS